MSTFIINSRKFGKQIFTAPQNGGYVRLNNSQICYGGYKTGPTVTISSGDLLEYAAKKWWNQHMRNLRNI